MTQWDDDANDTEFRRLFATLPVLEPSPGFVQAASDAAWGARLRRRRMFRLAAAAAVLVIVSTVALLVAFGAPRWMVLVAAEGATGLLMTSVWAATAVTEFWTLMLRGGTAVGRVAVMPQSVALLVTAEVLGAAALYSLHRLLRADVRFRSSRPLCI